MRVIQNVERYAHRCRRLRDVVGIWTLLFLLLPSSTAHGDKVAPNPDPARFEADIAAFEGEDAEQPPQENSIVFLGSSSIRLWPLATSFPDLPTINRGFGGSHYSDALHFADRILVGHRPAAFVLYSGDNDIESGKSPRQVADDCRLLIARLREHSPAAKVLVIAIKPSPSRWEHFPAMREANALIRADLERLDNTVWIDVATPMLGNDGQPCRQFFVEDCLHLNDQGYRLWSCLIRCAIRRDPFQTGS